jgi:hypothetical protein
MISVQHGPRFVESVKLSSPALIKFHTPRRSGDCRWRIVDEETGKVLDSYTPYKPKRDKPICGWAGSWAASMAH